MNPTSPQPTARSLAPPLPRFAQIEPVGHCNLACRMCTVHHRGDTVAELPYERFVALLDEWPDLEELHLQGLGEPMLHPRFFDMVEAAARRGVQVSANTNLTLLTPERAERCATSGLHALSVSLDGASAPVYEAVRQKARFAKVLRNLDRLVAARTRHGGQPQVRGVMVLMRQNLHELPALVQLLHDRGVDTLLVQRLSSDLAQPELPARYIPIRRYVETAELNDSDMDRVQNVFDQARALAQRLRFTLHLPRLSPAAPDTCGAGAGCTWPWDQLYLTAGGELLPCCMVATADRASFGRVFDAGSSLLERWQGPSAQAFRAALASAAPPSVCRGCALYRGTF